MPISARIALLLLVIVVLPARRAISDAADSAPFFLSVLRRDGIVIPIAAFDGKSWTMSWPEVVERADMPSDLGAVPRNWWGKTGLLTQLVAWANGASRGVIHLHLGKPVRLHIM